MENYIILLSRFELWVILVLAMIVVIGFITLGRGYLDEVHENERLRQRLQSAKEESADWHSKYMMATYKLVNAGGKANEDN